MPRSREENRSYMRDYRARSADGVSRITPDELVTPGDPGVEAGVRAQLAMLPAATEQPGVAAALIALARVLDNPGAVPQHPAAARTLGDMLGRLRAEARPSGTSHLSLLRAEADKRRAGMRAVR